MNPELRRRIAFTLCGLLIFRIGTYIPLPGIDLVVWEQFFRSESCGTRESCGTLGMLNMLSGGTVHRPSILALSVGPYITAAVLLQLLGMVGSPTLRGLSKAGEHGRRIVYEYTRSLALGLTLSLAYGISVALEGVGHLVGEPGILFRLSTVAALTGGTIFLVWLSELITARGVGNGLALILFVGIMTEAPSSFMAVLELRRQGLLTDHQILGLAVFTVAFIGSIVFMELARRRVPVEYPGRQVGHHRRTSDLSLKLNGAGVIPVVVVSWFLYLLIVVVADLARGFNGAWVTSVTRNFGSGTPGFVIAATIAIVMFAFLYTAFVLDPEEAAEKLKAYGGVIPGIATGPATAAHVDYVVSRTTVLGASYLALVFLIPELVIAYTKVSFYFGGVSALIVVCVVLDISAQVRKDGLLNTGGLRA
jgi:preprotein translocase subunit SecY